MATRQCTINYLMQRLDIEQERIMKAMTAITEAEDELCFITAAWPLFCVMPPSFNSKEFAKEVINDF